MDPLLHIIGKPDNIPVLLMIPGLGILLGWWWVTARRNDRALVQGGLDAVRRRMEGEPPLDGEVAARHVHSWPYLVRVELLAALVVMLVLIAWSILIDAPLEQMADATRTPNPSKAPWYFLGLQEMLVYFDPWIAGVVLPLLIIGGLCVVPYVDVNEQGNGYYSWRDRRFAVSTFLFGFVGLWVLLIVIGVFCRGPGWSWFWPWEVWDKTRIANQATLDWPALFGIRGARAASAFGGATMAAYYGTAVLYWFARRQRPTLRRLGAVRYGIVAFLLLTMLGLPIKVILRLALSVKYVWVTPWFNI